MTKAGKKNHNELDLGGNEFNPKIKIEISIE